ncbi:hypothetical protein CFK38_15265 [Brachybacterium vulturis]|uniref:Protein-glutamine gamma-glutamyltransferase-like C-terminal domain-containing protein n=1 Tax=Brachybacterium vulturis TaxID=2017484 RepID=A0A291GS14_9MICO|nr:DUF4129 domain-containing protein [Brachybacterium vulturis]ATG52734.1 hypothetical protein CFK38_15265 [Brachybacterium vulturis]
MTRAEPDAGTAARAGAPEGSAAHRRLVAGLLLVVSLGAIGLVALGAAADRGPSAVYSGRTEASYLWEPQREDYQEPDWSTHEVTTRPPDPEGANTGLLIALIVLGAILLVIAVWVAYRMRRLARPAPALAALADEDELTSDQAQAALQDARTRLSTVVDAHDAVIAAWLALERAIAEAGVRRSPSQTTLEFVVAVLGRRDLDRAALDRLAHLYRRALFDPRPLAEPDREEALGLLDKLTSGLDEGAERGEPR